MDKLVIIDIQPEFQRACSAMLHKVIERVNNAQEDIICFYVGKELGQDSKYDVMAYYMEHGMDPSQVEKMHYIDKDFGFFRNWMDAGVDESIIIKAVKHMKISGISDSRKFSQNDWDTILTPEDKKSFYLYDEPIFYPHFKASIFDKINKKNQQGYEKSNVQGSIEVSTPNDEETLPSRYELIGGARHECLAEIDIYLKSLGASTLVNEKLCYGVDKKSKNKPGR